MNGLNPTNMTWYSPKNLSQNALAPRNIGAPMRQNALAQSYRGYDAGGQGGGAGPNNGAGEAPDVSTMTANEKRSELNEFAQPAQHFFENLPFTGTLTKAYKAVRVHDLKKGLDADTNAPGGPNPGPGTGGAGASTPAGGAAAAAGTAPGTGDAESEGTAPAATHSAENDGNNGAGEGDSVICTELRRQGFIEDHIWEADEAYGRSVNAQVRAGYLMWGVPVVGAMKKSTKVTKSVHFFAKPWAHHMAYKMGAVPTDNVSGMVIMNLGVPVCWILGAGHFFSASFRELCAFRGN